MSGFMSLYAALGLGLPYIGLLFLLYWAAIRHQDFKEYIPSVLGGVNGLGLGWLLVAWPHTGGQTASILSYTALGAVLFCFMRGQAYPVANHCTLLFVLVAAIPELDVAHNIAEMVQSLLLAAAYMGLIAGALFAVQKWRAKKRAM